MRDSITDRGKKIIFSHADDEYELRSHPYEPCLYIYKNDELIKILHNAFDVYDLPSIFNRGETVRAIDGKEYDEDAFCRVLATAINDSRYEMDWPFAARLLGE